VKNNREKSEKRRFGKSKLRRRELKMPSKKSERFSKNVLMKKRKRKLSPLPKQKQSSPKSFNKRRIKRDKK
jgi:hypothetical protein